MLKFSIYVAAFVICARAVSAVEPAFDGMARIPAGAYQPLFRAATDAKEVAVKTFALDVFPVTNGDFLEFVRSNPGRQLR